MENFKEWNTMRNDNYKIGDWAIYAAGTAINSKYAYIGYVIAVGEYSVSLQITLQIDKFNEFKTSRVEKDTRINLRRYQVRKLTVIDNLGKFAERQIIHMLQLDAVQRNDEKRFYELGAKLNEQA